MFLQFLVCIGIEQWATKLFIKFDGRIKITLFSNLFAKLKNKNKIEILYSQKLENFNHFPCPFFEKTGNTKIEKKFT